MRVCVVTSDLGAVRTRRGDLFRQVAARTPNEMVPDVWFVGLRQTQPAGEGVPAYTPYVARDRYTQMRVANMVLRLVDARIVPMALARAGLGVAGPAIVEAVLACNPNLVLLDARWGECLVPLLDQEFPGRVEVRHRSDTMRPIPDASDGPAVDAKVTIVLPTFNGARYLRQSIHSCLNQTHGNLELIVVDDGSQEDIGAIVSTFPDGRVRYIRHQTNRGLSAALNTGFSVATGEYLTWTSDDNYYAANTIERLVRFLRRHPRISFVYSSMYIVNELGDGGAPRVQRALPPEHLTYENSVGGCFLYTREVFERVGEYDSSAVLVEDYDYWIRVWKQFRMQRLVEPLYYCRHHTESLTFKHGPQKVAVRFNAVKHQNGIA